MPRADAIHLGLMLLALAVAYVLPFELLLLSYAILGPVHYLTEISWLHDRKYFLAVTSPRVPRSSNFAIPTTWPNCTRWKRRAISPKPITPAIRCSFNGSSSARPRSTSPQRI